MKLTPEQVLLEQSLIEESSSAPLLEEGIEHFASLLRHVFDGLSLQAIMHLFDKNVKGAASPEETRALKAQLTKLSHAATLAQRIKEQLQTQFVHDDETMPGAEPPSMMAPEQPSMSSPFAVNHLTSGMKPY